MSHLMSHKAGHNKHDVTYSVPYDSLADLRTSAVMTPLAAAIKKSGKTANALANFLGVHRQNVYRWIKGKGVEDGVEFPREHAEKAASFLGTTAEFLVLGKPTPKLVSSFDPDAVDPLEQFGDDRPALAPRPEDFPRDAILEAAPRAGLGSGEAALTAFAREVDGVSEVDAIREDYWRFPQRFLNETLRRPATALLVIECEGDSMMPTLAPGERVWVDTTHKVPTPDGIYAMRDRFDNIVVKRVQLDESGDEPMLLIISDNPSHSTIRRRLDDVPIFGKVVGGFKLF